MKRIFLMMGACLALNITACKDTENDGTKALAETLIKKAAAAALDAEIQKGENQGDAANGSGEKNYSVLNIAGQTWMAENLNIETANSYCNQPDNCKANGRLYTWDAAQTVCPAGWHLPSESEARAMLDAVSDFRTAFNAKAIGFRKDNGEFLFGDLYEYFWTSDGKKDKASYWYWTAKDNSVKWLKGMKSSALSVRCVKGEAPSAPQMVNVAGKNWMARMLQKPNGSYVYSQDDALKACPSGWRLPTPKDYRNLLNSLSSKKCQKDRCSWKNAYPALKASGFDLKSIAYKEELMHEENVQNGIIVWANYGCDDGFCFEYRALEVQGNDVSLSGCFNEGAGCYGAREAGVLCVQK